MILVDTTPLVALVDRRDGRHRLALSQLDQLRTNEFGTCEAVLVEACFHLPYREQRERLRAWLDRLDVKPLPDVDQVNLREDVFSWILKYADHQPDWADACIAVLSGRDHSLEV